MGQSLEKSLKVALDSHKDMIESAMFSLSILKREMQKNTTYTLPFISLTIVLLLIFTVGSWRVHSFIVRSLIGLILA